MGQVSDIVLAQFAANFASAASALPVSSASPAASTAASVPGGAASTTATTQVAVPTRAQDLNALTLLWQLVKGWFAGLFGKRPGTTGS